ncbi:MAG TPA: hypothetical protein VN844_09280 [Pyrinomonadaceae bacterium]|nr:hypothetical protein [Pyrinomonadaceae bacterium]
MAGEDNLLNKLAALVATFDDASWEALASKGLLRRARKDLEKGIEIEIREQSANVLQISVPPFLVSFSEAGPGNATCSCPAPGMCQHIIAAGLYLQSRAKVAEEKVVTSAESVRDEIRLLTTERLKAWVGAAEYRKALALLEKNTLPPVIDYSDVVTVRLMPSAIEVRFVPHAGLEGMILPKQQGKRAGVAAIIALRKSLGFEIPAPVGQHSLVEITGTPRTKKEILNSACSVLEEAIAVGLSHPSEMLVNRLVTLSVSAQGAQMPRVALALKTVSDEVKSILEREARADEARLLLVMGRVYALMDAIRSGNDHQSVELAGTARGQYIEVPEMELSGVGAYTWQTGSGYVGLTLIFWTNQTSEFLTWSYARPEIQRADARQRFYGEGPWEGAQSPKQVSTSQLKLRHARRTVRGRLSGSTKTSALVLSPVKPETLDFGERLFTQWNELARYVASKRPLGLRDPNPLELIVVLQPHQFGERKFDSITQTFRWEVFDEIGASLTLALPFRDWTKESVAVLESLAPARDQTWKLLVKATPDDNELSVEPISILRPENSEGPVFHLAFDSLPEPGSVDVVSSSADSDDQPEESEEALVVEPIHAAVGSLRDVLTEINRRLEAIAESGVQTGIVAHREWFVRARSEIFNFGFTPLAKALDALCKPSVSPNAIVKARYLTHLYSQATEHLNSP